MAHSAQGTQAPLMTGESEDEAIFTLCEAPQSWVDAGPSDDGLLNYFIATPYPGSRLGEEKDQFNIDIVETNFAKYDCEHIIFETVNLNKKKLEKLFHTAKDIEKKFKSK